LEWAVKEDWWLDFLRKTLKVTDYARDFYVSAEVMAEELLIPEDALAIAVERYLKAQKGQVIDTHA
jgi:hypothetical protein